jgi:Sec-independent protein translocase protein TatA
MDAPATSEQILRRRISAWIVVVIVGLVVAGLTAFRWLTRSAGSSTS